MVLTRGRYGFSQLSFCYTIVNLPFPIHFIILTTLMLLVYITSTLFYFSISSDQLPVSTKYDLRSDPGVEKNYGKLLLEMASIVPDGIVCFFVSYSYMDGIVNSWHNSGLLKVKICMLI